MDAENLLLDAIARRRTKEAAYVLGPSATALYNR
jgi:hypothetical protein